MLIFNNVKILGLLPFLTLFTNIFLHNFLIHIYVISFPCLNKVNIFSRYEACEGNSVVWTTRNGKNTDGQVNL